MSVSRIDSRYCFYDSTEKLIVTATEPVDLKNCMNDRRYIAIEGAAVLTPRQVAESKLVCREGVAGVSQEKYDALQELCNAKAERIAAQGELIAELKAASSTSEDSERSGAEDKKPKGKRGRPKKV